MLKNLLIYCNLTYHPCTRLQWIYKVFKFQFLLNFLNFNLLLFLPSFQWIKYMYMYIFVLHSIGEYTSFHLDSVDKHWPCSNIQDAPKILEISESVTRILWWCLSKYIQECVCGKTQSMRCTFPPKGDTLF